MGIGGDRYVGKGPSGDGENIIPALNPSPSLGTNLKPIPNRIPNQTKVKLVYMGWGPVGTGWTRPIAIPTDTTQEIVLSQLALW